MRAGIVVGVLIMAHMMGGTAWAGITQPVPEISAGSVTTALGLLSAGILVLRARRGSK
jgi:hypothetical protein